jgi:hypothetical protein
MYGGGKKIGVVAVFKYKIMNRVGNEPFGENIIRGRSSQLKAVL